MAVSYIPPPKYSASYGGPAFRRTQSTSDEANRILDWNYTVTSATSPSVDHDITIPRRGSAPVHSLSRGHDYDYCSTAQPRGYDGCNDDDGRKPYTVIRRRVTTTTSTLSSHYEPAQVMGESSPSRDSSSLISGAVVGGLLGAAAGAALTFGMINYDKARTKRPEVDASPPVFQRRATFPDPFPDPMRRPRGRYVEVKRTTENIHFPNDSYAHDEATYGRYYPPRAGKPIRSREADDILSERGRGRGRTPTQSTGVVSRSASASSRSQLRSRTLSETGYARQPLLLTEREHSSVVNGRCGHSKYDDRAGAAFALPSRSRLAESETTASRSSYASARSHSYSSRHGSQRSGTSSVTTTSTETASTIRPSQSRIISQSRNGSRVTTTSIKLPALAMATSAASGRRMVDRTPSYTSARNVPLPPSTLGTGSTMDDDLVSLAPSDSISCVGSRRSTRRYR
jgi:hypothetical protein